jgi:hypothetical protein
LDYPSPQPTCFFGFEFFSLGNFFGEKMGKIVQIQGKIVNDKKNAKNLGSEI